MDIELDLDDLRPSQMSVRELNETRLLLNRLLLAQERAAMRLTAMFAERRSGWWPYARVLQRFYKASAISRALGGNQSVRRAIRRIDQELTLRLRNQIKD